MPPKLSSLTLTDKIPIAAELDGAQYCFPDNHGDLIRFFPERLPEPYVPVAIGSAGYGYLTPPYSTSYDAIIPLIQKQDGEARMKVMDYLSDYGCVFDATPSQLLDALLVATGKAEL